MATEVVVAKAPVPAAFVDWKRQKERTLNDSVEGYLIKLIEDPEYRSYLDATDDSEAIEGSLSADNYRAADGIKRMAQAAGDDFVGRAKLASILRSLNFVLNAYEMSRKKRKNTLGGKTLPGGENE